MGKKIVAIVKYDKPLESVRKAVELSKGLDHMPKGARVFIKPNIVTWTKAIVFPKYGVITTARVVEDMVVLLKERGIDDITIGEGIVTWRAKDTETPAHAFKYLGYDELKKRYGVKYLSVFERPFEEVDLGHGVVLNYNSDILNSDFVVNVPVLKTHSMTIVSLGIKNLKGMIDVSSRKKCHSADPDMDLHYMVARLASKLPPSFTLIDGIYSLKRGPSFDGKAVRSDVLIASADLLSADMVGTRVLGHDPKEIQHLVHAAGDLNRPLDLSDVEVVGKQIDEVASPHMALPLYNEEGTLPLPMVDMGITGLYYQKYDLSLCTYCSGLQWIIFSAIAMAWKGEPWDEVEILTGKIKKPTPGKNKTVLLGKCMYDANKNHPNIKELIAVRGCPPSPGAIAKALHRAGIYVDPAIFNNYDEAPGMFNRKYKDKSEFNESFYQIT